MGFDVNQLYAGVCGNDVFFAYQGGITSERINSILEEVEVKFVDISNNIKLKKKVYNIMVESLQNLFHHADFVPDDLVEIFGKSYGMVVIKKEEDHFLITVGNFISSDKVKFLTEKIEKINSLSSDELKDMYKFILNYQKLSAKGGGGLGLIDIARKSDKKLAYRFHLYNESYYFYRLDIFVSI